MLYREIRRRHILACSSTRSSAHPRPHLEPASSRYRRIPDPRSGAPRQGVLELFRLLRYLEYADPQNNDDDTLKNTILVFALITSELRLLLAGSTGACWPASLPRDGAQLYDSFVSACRWS